MPVRQTDLRHKLEVELIAARQEREEAERTLKARTSRSARSKVTGEDRKLMTWSRRSEPSSGNWPRRCHGSTGMRLKKQAQRLKRLSENLLSFRKNAGSRRG